MKKLLYISLIVNALFVIFGLFALNRFGGWKNLWAKINNRGIEKTYMHRKNLFEKLPSQDSTIVFLGNSITAHGEWAELLGNPKALNRGIPGDHCDGMRERLSEIERLNPAQIFLLAGVNDLAFHPPEVVIEKYERLVAEILKKMPSTTLYLQSVLPVNNIVSPTPIDNEDVVMLNQAIQKIASENGLTYIDLHSLLLDADGRLDARYTLDGVHLNGEAYVVWKNALKNGEWLMKND